MKLLTTFILSLAIFANAAELTDKTNMKKEDTQITISPNDNRLYKSITLENGMKMVLISDKNAQRSAAAVDVLVGSGDDPDEFPGLAHFLEHMLFLGTDKFPEADEYSNYISNHGGGHNAFTSFAHTNYFFDIDPKHLHGGLERFGRFFVAPLFSAKYVDRERNAVHSEYQSKLKEDGWRETEVLKQTFNPKNPHSRFSIGTNDTLPTATVRPALLKFYKKNYSSSNMSGVILGKEDLQTLEKWAKEIFSSVPKLDKDFKSTTSGKLPNLYLKKDLPIQIKSQLVKDKKEISFHFPMPYSTNNVYSKSLSYISYILGYEGEGSLLAALKKQNLGMELSSGESSKIGEETVFEIKIELTDTGYKSIDKVTNLVFSYLKLIESDNGEKRYKEVESISKLDFKYSEKTEPMYYTSGLAGKLNRYKTKDIISIYSIFSGYDKKEINEYLEMMTINNSIIHIASSGNEMNFKEKGKFFNVPFKKEVNKKYNLKLISAEDLLKQGMFLPKPNSFVSSNNNIIKDNIVKEKHTILENGIEVFYKNDTSFNIPKSNIFISLQSDKKLDKVSKVKTILLTKLLSESLNTTLYDADIAGLSAQIFSGEKSININISGYSDKSEELLKIILNKIKAAKFDEVLFKQMKEELTKDLENQRTAMPYQQTFPYLSYLIFDDYSLPTETLENLTNIDLKSVLEFRESLIKSLAARVLAYGNINYEKTLDITKSIKNTFDKTDFNHKYQLNKIKDITKSTGEAFFVPHTDNSILTYLLAEKGYKARANIGLLSKLVSPKFYNESRTEKQLGYVVFAFPKPFYDQAGIAFVIESPVATADKLDDHINKFLADIPKYLETISEEKLQEIKGILKSELLQKSKNISQAASKYWGDIQTTNKTDQTVNIIAGEIDSITKESFVEFTNRIIKKDLKVTIKAMPTR